ncbi:MAG TPA: DNA-binding transcriptional regulator [Pirellulaceae bacterium]|nr:DNA-binding transcriptional regulator [Pirellulaceae bacterium]
MRRRRVLLMIETSLAYGRDLLRGINRYVVEHGPWSLYLDQRELMSQPPDWLARWDGDGIISRWTTPELANQFRAMPTPVVDLTDVYGNLGLAHLWTDNIAVGELAARHLLERGFRHFAFCGYSNHDWSRRRMRGFEQTLRDAGHDCSILESTWQTLLMPNWDEQQEAIGAWLRDLPKPLGVMACNDMRGQQVLDACRRFDLAVPEEVAVIGVDNDELLCILCDPPLTSVTPNPERIGYEAAALLDRFMQGEARVASEILVEPIGIATRQSTDILAIDQPQVSAALRYIREHACQGISVGDVLKHVPIARSVLERQFRHYLSRSPQEEIRGVQMKRVCQLLAETDLALAQIAALTGFQHAEYLSVVFKRLTNETPGHYRKRVAPGK